MRRALWCSLAAALIGMACGGGTNTDFDPSTGGGVDATAASDPDAMVGSPDAMTSSPDAGASTPDAMEGVIDASGGGGACVNAADTAVWESEDVEGAAADCGSACIFDTTPNCVRECLVEATGLSEPCADCFDALVGCMVANCAFQCFAPESAECETCRLANCATPFTECSGY